MMEKVCCNPGSPASYNGKKAVYKAAKALYPKITQRKVAIWLSKQFNYTMHKPVSYHFKANQVFAEGIEYQWQTGLADLGSVHLLTCIDIFSKYDWAIPLKNKTGITLVSAFKTILSSNRKPAFLQTDDGTEFKNSVFQQFLKDSGIKFLTTESEKSL